MSFILQISNLPQFHLVWSLKPKQGTIVFFRVIINYNTFTLQIDKVYRHFLWKLFVQCSFIFRQNIWADVVSSLEMLENTLLPNLHGTKNLQTLRNFITKMCNFSQDQAVARTHFTKLL